MPKWLLFAVACMSAYGAPTLRALPGYLRPDAFGNIVTTDRVAGAAPAAEIQLTTARHGYASCHLIVELPEGGAYSLSVGAFSAGSRGVETSLYREWLHYLPSAKEYIPDALVPLKTPYTSRMPSPDNRVPGQKAQGFWLDIWVPDSIAPGNYTAKAELRTSGRVVSLAIQVRVLRAQVPEEDALVLDHNTYGTSWLAEQYPALAKRLGAGFYESPEYFHLLQAYHRIFYEHRGILHQLGYGHAGKVGPEFAPVLAGRGKDKHVADWTTYDRHFGPLFDGSAFQNMHRPAKAIPYVYLPINPEWPASYENWGEPGYEREFVNVVSEMEKHFREEGWTNTHFELFFNHKARYKGFPWDGDESRFAHDYAYFKEYAQMMRLAVPQDTPVKFLFRADVSWTMEREWRELAGIVNFWVCGGGMVSWYPQEFKELQKRGDTAWTYEGTPAVTEPSSHISLEVLRAWIQGSQGFVRWLTTAPGPDPWFHLRSGTEVLVYSGDRFGLAEPIPSIRLKLERNTLQDLAQLDALTKRADGENLRAEAVKSFNGSKLAEWWNPRPQFADTDPLEWSNADIADATQSSPRFGKELDAAAWQRVHELVLQKANELP